MPHYLLFGCRTPFRGWLITTGWLSQRRLESNFFPRRQQLRSEFGLTYSACFLDLVLSFSHFSIFFFLPFFLLPSLLHWPLTGSLNFSQCVARGSWGAVQAKAGLSSSVPPLRPMTAGF